MAVLQMQRISICALKKDRKKILEKLQIMGVMEMNQILEDDADFKKMETVNARTGFERKAQVADQALDILNTYAPIKQSMLSSFEGKALIDKERYEQIVLQKEAVVQKASRLVSMNKEIAENKANVLKLENQIESLTPWLALDVPMNFKGTKSTAMITGTMSSVMTAEEIYALIAQHAPDAAAVDVSVLSADRDLTYLVVLCLNTDAAVIEEALRHGGFAKPSQMVNRVPAKLKSELEAQIEKLNKENKKVEEKITGFSDSRNDLKLTADYFRTRAEKYEVLGTLPQSGKTFVISGYVPAKAVPAVEKVIGEQFDCILDIETADEDDNAPVLLQNNVFSESVEGVLSSYGLPKKGEMDPTTVMSFFYVFLFGLMLSDAAYGMIIFVACFVLLKKFPRMEAGLRKSIRMFMYCGISTLVWGILFGGYFGDAIDVIARHFFNVNLPEGQSIIPALWFVPLNNPMQMLVYSMLFGVIHLFAGLALKGYMLLKDGKVFDFFCDVVLWYCLLSGLILILLPTDIFASIAQTQIVFPPAVSALAKGLSIFGAVGLLFMSARDNKNFGLRIALGAYELYNITGWLSDVLSYSRLLALGLATGVIASVINQMGSMIGGPIGVVVFIVVFIIGHIFNMAINILGAYVHTNRLQFVEFFGKFYEGGGRAFNPFKSNTKYVDIKEETYL